MMGVPTPERLAELLAISRAQASDGPPTAATRPIVVNDRGYAYGLCPGDLDGIVGSFVHAGLRLAWAPMPVQNGVLLSLWGGLQPEAGYEEEGVTAFVTGEGLRRLAADLLAIAGTSIDQVADAGSTTHSGGEGVTQADREAAASLKTTSAWARPRILAGELDERDDVQAFARHRLATTPSPDAAPDSGEAGLCTALIGGPLDDEAQSTLGRFGWLSAIITDLKSCPAAMSALAAEDPASAAEAMSEVEALLQDVRLALADQSPSPAIVKEAGEVERLRHVVDRDRYVVAIGLEAIRKAVGGHRWLLEGRGPYAWDDDDYRREFGAAIENVEAALVPLATLAADKSDCTTDSVKVQEARAAARQYLDARVALSASNAAQVSK